MENRSILDGLYREQRELYGKLETIHNQIDENKGKIEIYKRKVYMNCNHKWRLDERYSSPHNDKEYICDICGLNKDYDMESLKYKIMFKKK